MSLQSPPQWKKGREEKRHRQQKPDLVSNSFLFSIARKERISLAEAILSIRIIDAAIIHTWTKFE